MRHIVPSALVIFLSLLVISPVNGLVPPNWTVEIGETGGLALARVNDDAILDPIAYHWYSVPGLVPTDVSSGVPLLDERVFGKASNILGLSSYLLGKSDGGVVALDGRTGASLWSKDLAGSPTALLRTDLEGDGMDEILVATHTHPLERGFLYLLSARDGQVLGTTQTLEGFVRSMSVADFNQDGTLDVALAVMWNDFCCPTHHAKLWGDRIEVVNGAILRVTGPTGLFMKSAPPLLWASSLDCPPSYPCWARHHDALQAGDLDGDGKPDLVVLNDAGGLEAFDGATGARLWLRHTDRTDDSGLAVHDGVVFVPTTEGFVAIDGATNATLWSDPHRSYRTSTVRVVQSNERVLAITGDLVARPGVRESHVLVYDAATGAIVWTVDLSNPELNHEPHDIVIADVHASPGLEVVVSATRPCCGSGGFNLLQDPGVVLVLRLDDGAILSQLNIETSALRIGVQARGEGAEVFAPSFSGTVYAFDLG